MSQNKYVYKIFLDLFEKEKERISRSLTFAFEIADIGSTPTPALGGNGIIDIAIAIAQKQK